MIKRGKKSKTQMEKGWKEETTDRDRETERNRDRERHRDTERGDIEGLLCHCV